MSKKISIDITNLPEVPQIPNENSTVNKKCNQIKNNEDGDQLLKMLNSLKEREDLLLETIKNIDNEHDEIIQAAEMSTSLTNKNNNTLENEYHEFIAPLLKRTQSTISTLLSTKDSLDQLDSLHRIIHKLLNVQEQNYQMRKRLKTVKTLSVLKELELQINNHSEKFLNSNVFLEEGSDNEGMLELEQNIADLETMLAASKSASSKRNSSKKQRNKSIVVDDIEEPVTPLKENNRNYPLRRQSAIGDFKPKVSKWTKVKAAFKWEKASALTLNESKSSDNILSPHNDSFRNYLKVPSTSAPYNSGDSQFSTSTREMIISSTPSSGDENDEITATPTKDPNRFQTFHDSDRRSCSLDGEMAFGGLRSDKSNSQKNSKSAWSKVKCIVTNRTSRKSIKSTESGNSRDVSPIEFNDHDRNDSASSQNQSSSPNNLNLMIPDIDLCTSDEHENRTSEMRLVKNGRKAKSSSKKNTNIEEIENLNEIQPNDLSVDRKKLPSPLILKRDEDEFNVLDEMIPNYRKLGYYKSLSVSSPNSPMKNDEFFSEMDFLSGAENFNVVPISSPKRGSNKSSNSSRQQYEIMKNYQELQKKITLEFQSKQQEWVKLRPLLLQLNNSVPDYLKEDLSLPSTPKNLIENLIVNEENLSADFKRKLEEWRLKKNQQSVKKSKSGQKYENNQIPYGLPDFKDLPEDFQKKFNEWKQMKAEGKSPPPYSHQASVQEKLKRQFSKIDKSFNESTIKKSKTIDEKLDVEMLDVINDEIVVQTSDGLMKFKGISRSFTRKLYEWEKAKGIEPASDSSTFAFLHPKYKAKKINENENKDCENGMKRALSVDSIKPIQSMSQMSHSQPSSLSLNDADNMKEPKEKKASSQVDLYCEVSENQYDSIEGPVIVEVEDELLSSASSQMQIPIFKFDFANQGLRNVRNDQSRKILIDLQILNNKFQETMLDVTSINSIENLEIIKHLCEKLKELSHISTQAKIITIAEKIEVLEIIKNLRENIKRMTSNELNLQDVNDWLIVLDSDLNRYEELFRNLDVLEKYPGQSRQAISSIQNSEDKGVATVKITPTFICNQVRVDEFGTSKGINRNNHLKVSSDSEKPELSTEDMKSDDKPTRKVTRNSSSSSKRKIRLRRIGSRQNSKTESDSDDEFMQSSEAQRKLKRKSSRIKKPLDSDKSFDSFQGDEEVVYIFKIKPGETNEITTVKNYEMSNDKSNDSVLISPIENCVELIEVSPNDISSTSKTNPIVKTIRKIFSPVDIENESNDNALFISHVIESSSSSEKTDKEKKNEPLNVFETTNRLTSLQQLDIGTEKKDISPSIQSMIDKYHQNIEQKSNPNSNSSSPIWRSPILDRRVRKQSADYQIKILKSNSFQEISEVQVVADDSKMLNVNLNNLSKEKKVPQEKEIHSKNDTPTRNPKETSTGAIPKVPKLPQIQVIRSSDCMSDSSILSEPFSIESHPERPKTPISERALKIKQAKEAFLKSSFSSQSEEQSRWQYRLSQISVGSTDSNSIENMSNSCIILPTSNFKQETSLNEAKTSSLPRNIVPSTSNNQEFGNDTTKDSKFRFSNLATKLRKVKLKRNIKDVQKMNTVPVLCKQSLNLFNDSTYSKNCNTSTDNVQKSKSLGNI